MSYSQGRSWDFPSFPSHTTHSFPQSFPAHARISDNQHLTSSQIVDNAGNSLSEDFYVPNGSRLDLYTRSGCSTSLHSPSFASSSHDSLYGREVGMLGEMLHDPGYSQSGISIQDSSATEYSSIGGTTGTPRPPPFMTGPAFSGSMVYTGSDQLVGNDPTNSCGWNPSNNGLDGSGPFTQRITPQARSPLRLSSPHGCPSPESTFPMYPGQPVSPTSTSSPSQLHSSPMMHRQMRPPPIEPLRAPDMPIGEQDQNGVSIPGALWQDTFKCYWHDWHDGRCGVILHRESFISYRHFLESTFSHLGAHVGSKNGPFCCQWQGCVFECTAEKVKNERDRIRHVLTHLRSRWRYLCVRCGRTYSRKDTRKQKHACHPKLGVPSPEACNGVTLAYFWAYYGDGTSSP